MLSSDFCVNPHNHLRLCLLPGLTIVQLTERVSPPVFHPGAISTLLSLSPVYKKKSLNSWVSRAVSLQGPDARWNLLQ